MFNLTLDFIRDYIRSAAEESRKFISKTNPLSDIHEVHRKKPKNERNFYVDRFGMPLVSLRDCGDLENKIDTDSTKINDGVENCVRSYRAGEIFERRNKLARTEEDIRIIKHGSEINFFTTKSCIDVVKK